MSQQYVHCGWQVQIHTIIRMDVAILKAFCNIYYDYLCARVFGNSDAPEN
jgi:hypothetical protein